MVNYNLNHLKELEAESIFILREVAAVFENPKPGALRRSRNLSF